MSNLCWNKLVISGPDKDVKAFIKQAKALEHVYQFRGRPEEYKVAVTRSEMLELSFHALVPIPDEILEGEYEPKGRNKEYELWGCKYGAMDPVLENCDNGLVEYAFDTPWSPPTQFLLSVSRKFPTLLFDMKYDEPGNDIWGRVLVKNGIKEKEATWQ